VNSEGNIYQQLSESIGGSKIEDREEKIGCHFYWNLTEIITLAIKFQLKSIN